MLVEQRMLARMDSRKKKGAGTIKRRTLERLGIVQRGMLETRWVIEKCWGGVT